MADSVPSNADLVAELAAVRRELERYRTIVQQLNTGIHVYALEDLADDHTLRMVDANPAVALLTGVDPVDQLGKTLDQNFPGLREQGVPQAYAQVVRSGESMETETVYGDERVINAAFAVRAVPLPANEVAILFDNITLRKQTELDLKQLNAELEQRIAERTTEAQAIRAHLQMIVDNLPGAVFWKDLASVYEGCNFTFARHAGLSAPAEILGKTDYDLPWTHEQADSYRAYDRRIMDSGVAELHIVETLTQADGRLVWVDTNKIPLYNQAGEVVGILGSYEDITERKQTEQALRESQQLLKTIFDHLPVGLMLKDAAEGRFMLWNRTAELHYGIRSEEIIGKTDRERLPEELYTKLRTKHQEIFAHGTALVELEEFIDSPQLGRISASITRVPIFDEAGQPAYMLIITNDLSEQKRAADERAELQAQIIEAQQQSLRELSTPLLPIGERIVLMPIIGAVDSRRASQVLETLLQGVAQYNAEIAIVDITGVQVVDTQVANAFIQAARAVQLLGARVLLTGIKPEVAQTLVQLGVDLHDITSRGSLQNGIAYALKLAREGS